jgi:hypothetical protein
MGDGQGMSTTKKVLIGLGIVALGVLAYQLLTTTSEEPPIRVKKGSMHLDLLTTGAGWNQDDSDGKEWSPKGSGQNSAHKYALTWSLNGTPCEGALPTEANRVEVWYSDSTKVDIKHQPSHKSKLTGSATLSKTNDERRLTYGLAGFVARVRVTPGNFDCSFSAGEFLGLCLCQGTACPSNCMTAPPN